MLRDRYDKLFLKIRETATRLDPELAQIDQLLDDEALYQMMRSDLSRRYAKTTQTGRPSTPVEVVLRMLAVKPHNLSYEQTEHAVRDSLVLRQFCRVYFQEVPDDTTLIRWANQIQPETVVQFNQRLSQLAYQLKVTRGRKLRTDGTVVETNIAYPSDSKLLVDGVRVISRTLKRIQATVAEHIEQVADRFRARTRSARNQARRIQLTHPFSPRVSHQELTRLRLRPTSCTRGRWQVAGGRWLCTILLRAKLDSFATTFDLQDF